MSKRKEVVTRDDETRQRAAEFRRRDEEAERGRAKYLRSIGRAPESSALGGREDTDGD